MDLGKQRTNLTPLLITIVSAFLALILRHKNKDTVASYALVASAVMQVIPSMSGSYAFMVVMLPISITALYFNKWLFIMVGSIINVALIITQLVMPDSSIATNMFAAVILILITIILFFLTKEGGKLIQNAIENEAQTKKLLDELQNTMNVVKNSTSGLNSDISQATENLEIVQEISSSITITTEEFTTGIVGQSSSVS